MDKARMWLVLRFKWDQNVVRETDKEKKIQAVYDF